MKVLLSCLNVNGLGGSELYHYELARELNLLGIDVTLFTLRDIDRGDLVRKKLEENNVKQCDLHNIDVNQNYDLIVASQPEVNQFILKYFNNNIPKISIIHSEIRSETPILNKGINHYIAIREPIKKSLIDNYKINPTDISLIYNPIDRDRFNDKDKSKYSKKTGIFVGEVLDNIRFKAVSHLVKNCIDKDWDLYLMSESKYNFNHPNIKYIDKRWDTENVVKNMDFTAGILLGRTTLEGWCCGVNGYMYIINQNGDIVSIDINKPENIEELCDSKNVAKQHIELYNKIIR
jgi:glycosyltransferase involved in cell wall biosynthesis